MGDGITLCGCLRKAEELRYKTGFLNLFLEMGTKSDQFLCSAKVSGNVRNSRQRLRRRWEHAADFGATVSACGFCPLHE